MKDKSWIKSPWAISVGPVIIGFILTVLYDYFKNKPVLSTIWEIIKFLWNLVVSFLNLRLKIWWLLVGIASLALILYVISELQNVKPYYFNYTEGLFKRWKWTWKWEWDKYEKAWDIKELCAHCPDCGTFMIHYKNIYDGEEYSCPRCNFRAKGDECEDQQKIKVLICDNIERERKNKSLQNAKSKGGSKKSR